MRGIRNVSSRQIRAWGQKLGLTPEEIAIYITGESISSEAESQREQRLRQWSEEATALMTSESHWQFLRLARSPDFRHDTRWIASQIGVSLDEVNIIFTRLLRLGLLQATPPDCWTIDKNLKTDNRQEFVQFALTRLRDRSQAA